MRSSTPTARQTASAVALLSPVTTSTCRRSGQQMGYNLQKQVNMHSLNSIYLCVVVSPKWLSIAEDQISNADTLQCTDLCF